MSARGFLILLVATILAVVVAAVAAVQPTLSGVETGSGEAMFPDLSQKPADAGKVTVQTPQYSISWEQRDGIWVSPDRGNYPARKTIVSDLVLSLARMNKVEAKTSQPEWYQYIRVGDPTATPPSGFAHVTVASADGRALSDTIVGARSYSIPASHIRGGTFVRIPSETQSWLVDGAVSIPTELPEWFDTVLDIPGTQLSSVAVLSGDKVLIEAKKTDETNGIYELVQVDHSVGAEGKAANSNTIRNMASAIVGLRVEDVRAADSLSPGPDVRTDRFTTASGMQLDIQVVEDDGGVWATIKASAPEGSEAAAAAAEINARTANWAFLLNQSRASRLNQPVANLIEKPSDPAEGGVGPIPLDQLGQPMLPPGVGGPGAGAPGVQVLPGF